MTEMDRRTFLGRGGALVAALAALSATPGFAASALAAGSELSEAELTTYRALLDALGEVPGTRIDPSKADEAVAFFADWFDAQPDDRRRAVLVVLERLEHGPAHGFSTAGKSDALAFLRRWHNARTPKERAFEAKARKLSAGDARPLAAYVKEQERLVRRRAEEVREAHGAFVLEPAPVTFLPPYQPPVGDVDVPDWEGEEKQPAVQHRQLATAALELAGLFFYRPTDAEIEAKATAGPAI